jgi:glycosyltransferase involved in cell wall biosynthesis
VNRLGQTEIVLLQRRLLPRWQLALLRRSARLLIFDYDDAVFLRDSYSQKGLHSARRSQRFAAIMRAADLVVAGNTFLAEQGRAVTGAANIHVIPTCLDLDRYPAAPHVRIGKSVQLVWVGSSSTLHGLERVRPLLEEVGQNCPEVQLKLLCDKFISFVHLPVVPSRWNEATEAQELAAADIGISWLPDDAWSRGKCGLKVLQYMAAGLPVVANPVGIQTDLVRDGETGFLAETAADWVAAVRRLAHDPHLRRQLGHAGRRRVKADFSVTLGAARWLALLRGLQRRRDVA